MNLLVGEARGSAAPRTLLALEDGTVFAGYAAGAEGETFGEIVFNTSMTGYQEIVTDPSYAGQIVVLTYPQIGNYGVAAAVAQAEQAHLRGLVVRDLCRTPSNWTSEGGLREMLTAAGIVAIEGVDTRALTLDIRDNGAMRAAISTTDLDPEHLVARVRASEPISAHNYVADVSGGVAAVAPDGKAVAHVVAYDCGEKTGIAEGLSREGIDVTTVAWDTPADEALAAVPGGADGVFFSNGPGDPEQVAATAEAARSLLGRAPVFGICLGNQILSRAAGATIEKLPFGHHGGNEPVMNLLTGRVEITAQNHNYGLRWDDALGPLVSELSAGETDHHADDLRFWSGRHIAPVAMTRELGRVRLTHVNLNDGTPEGIQFLDVPAFSVQYHPEACPGPHDSSYLFRAFARLLADPKSTDYLAIDFAEGRRF